MKKIVIMIGLCVSVISAKTLDFDTLMTEVKAHHPEFQVKEQMRLALEAQSQSESASKPISLVGNIANASPDAGDDALEYSFGLSKNFALGGKLEHTLKAKQLANAVTLLKKEKALIALTNRFHNLYHQSCMDKVYRALLERSLESYETLYRKKHKAYKLDDVSKKDLLSLQMQMRTMRQRLQSTQASERIERERLYDLARLDGDVDFSCQDVLPVVAKIDYHDSEFVLSEEMFTKRMTRLDSLKKRYDIGIEGINLGLSYDDEIDTKRVGVGFAIPLSMTSAKNEQKRIAILHQRALAKLTYQNWLSLQKSEIKHLKSQLENSYNTIMMMTENVHDYENTLMPLIEKSFQYGESSSLEYILGRQKLLTLSQSLIEMKKHYYETLFTLYTDLETEK